jgi:hypothetical protein
MSQRAADQSIASDADDPDPQKVGAPMPKKKTRNYTDREADARHEAAHAVMAHLLKQAPRSAGLCPGDRYGDPPAEQLAAERYRPPAGTVVDDATRAALEKAAMVYAAGVAADLRHKFTEPPSGYEPNRYEHPDWEIAHRLIGRNVPADHRGEHFHARMAIYRQVSRLLAHPPYDAAVKALAGAILTFGHFPADRVTATIQYAIKQAEYASSTAATSTANAVGISCPMCHQPVPGAAAAPAITIPVQPKTVLGCRSMADALLDDDDD